MKMKKIRLDLLQHVVPALENLLSGVDYPVAAEEFKLPSDDHA